MSKSFASLDIIKKFIDSNSKIEENIDNYILEVQRACWDFEGDLKNKINEIEGDKNKLEFWKDRCDSKVAKAERELQKATAVNASTPSTITKTSTDSQGNKTNTTVNNPEKALAVNAMANASNNLSSLKKLQSKILTTMNNLNDVLRELNVLEKAINDINSSGLSRCRQILNRVKIANEQAKKAYDAIRKYQSISI